MERMTIQSSGVTLDRWCKNRILFVMLWLQYIVMEPTDIHNNSEFLLYRRQHSKFTYFVLPRRDESSGKPCAVIEAL